MFVLRSIQLTLWQKLVLVVVIAGGAALIPAVGSTGGPLPIVDFNVTTAPATSEGAGGASTDFAFVVNPSAAPASPIELTITLDDGTATALNDGLLLLTSSPLVFNADLQQNVFVRVPNDLIVEMDETFGITLTDTSSPGDNVTFSGMEGASPTTTIVNDDFATIVIGDVTQAEGNGGGTTAFTFDVTLDKDVDVQVTVQADSAVGGGNPGTAGGGDFNDLMASLVNFGTPASAQTIQVTVNVVADGLDETDETFVVNLSGLMNNGRAVIVTTPTGLGTIQNDDAAPVGSTVLGVTPLAAAVAPGGTVNFTITDLNDGNADLGAAQVDVWRSDNSAPPVLVATLATGAAGESAANDDVLAMGETFTWNYASTAVTGQSQFWFFGHGTFTFDGIPYDVTFQDLPENDALPGFTLIDDADEAVHVAVAALSTDLTATDDTPMGTGEIFAGVTPVFTIVETNDSGSSQALTGVLVDVFKQGASDGAPVYVGRCSVLPPSNRERTTTYSTTGRYSPGPGSLQRPRLRTRTTGSLRMGWPRSAASRSIPPQMTQSTDSPPSGPS